jgi:hypothetical protein
MADDVANSDSLQDFARAFADALWQYLEGRMGQSEAAKLLGLNRSRLNSYFHDLPDGTRKEPKASVLYLACTKFPRFYFDFGGYRMRAVKLGEKHREKPTGQLAFSFRRQFELADDAGNVNVRVKKPSGRIELSVSLDAKASSQRHK